MNTNWRKQHWEIKDDHVLNVQEEEVSCSSLQMGPVGLSEEDKTQVNEPPNTDTVSETEYRHATSKWRNFRQLN
jgi:hypothetical protein